MKKTLLIANRGEIAVRLAATARDQGYAVVTVYPEDDATCAHVREGDASVLLPGIGAAAYLDAEAVIQAAVELGNSASPGIGSSVSKAISPRLAKRQASHLLAQRQPSSLCSATKQAPKKSRRPATYLSFQVPRAQRTLTQHSLSRRNILTSISW